MSRNKVILFSGLIIFLCVTIYALFRELDRNEQQIKSSISGVIHLAPNAGVSIIRTDNAHVILFDPVTLKPVAINTINPFVPPFTFQVGQEHVIGNVQLSGSYRLLVVSDRDGKLQNPAQGEVIGPLTTPISLATEGFEYTLTQPFRQLPQELLKSSGSPSNDPSLMIQGVVTVSPELQSQIHAADRLIIMLFDMQKGRPVAIKIIPHFNSNQSFSIGQEQAMPGQNLAGSYSLRILTDNNNQPFEASPGEIIGRSEELIPLGTQNLKFVLDQEYYKRNTTQ